MASKCNCCRNQILNAEFVSCAGACKELFHIKCVAVTKSMLHAVQTCPNIHWYCHECNNGSRNISTSTDQINDAIGVLTNSLSGNLIQFVNNYKSSTETFMDTISTTIVPNGSSVITMAQKENVHTRNDDPVLMSLESNIKRSHSVAATTHCDGGPLRTVVVSNIGKDITVDYLTDYLVDELKVNKEMIHLSLFLPYGKTVEDLKFLQYKITLPEANYSAVMCSELWPKNVRVRDFFVGQTKKVEGVTQHQFFVKKTLRSCLDSPSPSKG